MRNCLCSFNYIDGKFMKNSLALATCLMVAAAGAQAQATVKISGLMDVYAGSMKMAGDTVSKSVVGSGGMTTSWYGFSGSEDLGGGLKANFALNGFFRPDTGETGRFGGDPQFSRDAFVSLSGNFGEVALGRGKAPNFLPTILFNPVGDSFQFSPLVLHSNVSLFNGTGWASTNPSDTGWSNQITYSSPSFSGLKANVHYQAGEVANNKKNIGLNLLYSTGPLGLTAFWERDQVKNPATPANLITPLLADTRTVWMLGGSYDATVVKGFATYSKSSSDLTAVADKTTWSLGASAPVAGGKVLLAYAESKVQGGKERNTATLGYDYFLSKRTDVYAMLMRDKITSFESGTSFGLGVRHRF